MLFIFFLKLIMLFVFLLLGVAFFSLLERKVLSYSQIRKGPNKIGEGGIFQPFSDGLKLFTKELNVLKISKKIIYKIMPGFNIFYMMLIWFTTLSIHSTHHLEFSLMMLLVLLSLSALPLIFSGWSSSSKYSFLGSVRGVSQLISYEVILMTWLLLIILVNLSCFANCNNFIYYNLSWLQFFFILLIWLFSLLTETNRAPFDFSEGESELVSGFNTEYSAGYFSLFFIAEYGMILFFSLFTANYFWKNTKFIMNLLIFIFLSFSWIWVRCTYPRYRYDFLMNICWKSLLPFLLLIFMFFMIN